MKQPLWKVLLSHITEIPLEHLSSEVNPSLHVTLNRGRYQLSTDNSIYSYADLYDNFTKAFKKIALDRLPDDKVLILGFGLGSIPVILEKKFKKQFSYTGIEKDETVIYLVNKYVIDTLRSPVELIHADANLFVQQSEEQFGLICMDVFKDDLVPEIFEKEDFLFQLKRILHPEGLLLFNKLTTGYDTRAQTRHFYEYTFKNIFTEGAYLDVGGNWILVSDKTRIRE